MAVDGLAALVMGRLFDIKGISVLAVITAVTALFAPLVFFGHFTGALIGIVLWGIGMGAQETVMRAIVAHLVPPQKRGSAYGVMNMAFGIFWAAGSAVMGLFYDISLLYLVILSVALQLAAVPIFLTIRLKKAV
jgi:MFS family permease